MDFGKEGGQALAGGQLAPREKPLVQPAARRLLRRRLLEPELIDSLCHHTDELLIRSGSEEDGGKRAGSVTEPDNSSQSKAARERLSSISSSLPPNEIMSLAAAEGR